MNKQLISLLITLAMPLAVNAEQPPPPPPPVADQAPPPPPSEMGPDHGKQHGRHMEMVAKELGLNSEQKGRMKDIFEEQRVKMKAIHEETRTRLRAVLTPEQLTKFESLHQGAHPPRPE